MAAKIAQLYYALGFELECTDIFIRDTDQQRNSVWRPRW